VPRFAAAQTVAAVPATTAAANQEEDDPSVLDQAEPDVVVVNLPTTLRLPRLKGNFRLTHRFAGNLRNGSFSDQLGSLFGIDLGAIIGFEYRISIAPKTQAAFYRSSFDKTIQFLGKYDAIRQGRSMPVSVSPVVSVEGTDNFQDKYAPAVGAVISRRLGTRAAAYLTPMWVNNTAASLAPVGHSHDGAGEAGDPDSTQSTTFVGIGSRVRVHGATYVAGEVVIRARGYAPGEPAYGFSLEQRVGSHMFSLTFTNTFGTTFAQLARGGAANTLFLGFNLGRKFF